MIEDGIFEEKATAGDNGEHETAICGKFNKFNLESCIRNFVKNVHSGSGSSFGKIQKGYGATQL